MWKGVEGCDLPRNLFRMGLWPCFSFPQAFLIRLLRNLIDKQTWTDEGSVSERMLRSQLLLLACVRKYQPCVQRAEGHFREWKDANGNLRLVLIRQQIFSLKHIISASYYQQCNVGKKMTLRVFWEFWAPLDVAQPSCPQRKAATYSHPPLLMHIWHVYIYNSSLSCYPLEKVTYNLILLNL